MLGHVLLLATGKGSLDSGVEVLEYRGDKPIYLFREVNSDVFVNMTLNPN